MRRKCRNTFFDSGSSVTLDGVYLGLEDGYALVEYLTADLPERLKVRQPSLVGPVKDRSGDVTVLRSECMPDYVEAES